MFIKIKHIFNFILKIKENSFFILHRENNAATISSCRYTLKMGFYYWEVLSILYMN